MAFYSLQRTTGGWLEAHTIVRLADATTLFPLVVNLPAYARALFVLFCLRTFSTVPALRCMPDEYAWLLPVLQQFTRYAGVTRV